jgi:nicotinamidase-related amidase
MAQDVLLVIDMQTGAFEGRWAMPDGPGLIAACQRAVAWVRAQAALVIWVQHHEPEGPLSGTGFAVDSRLDPKADEPRVVKTEPDAFSNAALARLLAGKTRILVAGLQSEVCVRATVVGGLAVGLPMTLVADAHHTWRAGERTAEQMREAVNTELAQAGVPLVSLADLEGTQ